MIGYFTAIKLIAMPVAAIFTARALDVSGVFLDVVVLFSALPTATSAYVLAVRMGGDGSLVALGITISTLAGMVAIPLWLNVSRIF